MAVLNYADKFKHTGKGYMDHKMDPVATLEELTSISAFQLAKLYMPGMVVLVLDDGLGQGPADYVLNEEYQWVKLVDNSGIVKEIEGLKEETKSLSERLSEIANKADANQGELQSLSDKIAKIAGIENLRAGENVEIVTNEDGTATISVDFSNIPTTDISGLETRVDAIEERIDSITGGEGDIAVDNQTIIKDENKVLSVKISEKEGNALVKEEDGLFSQGIYVSGDDAENEIL